MRPSRQSTLQLASVSVTHWPETLNAYDFFLGARIEEGLENRVAITSDDGDFTFGELAGLAAGYERELTEVGVGRGDRVLVVMPDEVGFAASLMAIFRMGAVVVMLNPHLKEDTMGATIDRTGASAAVVHQDHREHFDSSLREIRPRVVDPIDVASSAFETSTAATGPEDPAIWIFSGGTTGLPKAAIQTHRSLVNTTRLYGQGSLGLHAGDTSMAVPKLYFGYATGSNLLFPMSVGARSVLFRDHPTPEVLFSKIEEHRPTVLVNVPSAINQMLSHPGAAERDLSSLRISTSAGEALPETLYHRWKETFGVELLDGLGTAEMWHIFVTNKLGEVKPGTLGTVVPGFEIHARNEDGEDVPAGDVGRMWVRGDSLALGYHDNPEQTAEAFRDGWFVGGDLISIDSEGYVSHRGRADDAIKIKGKWFRPQEVESVLLDHDAVKECAVVAVDDQDGLSKPVAFVVTNDAVSEQVLIDWVLDHLEAYKHPRRVFFVEQLPQTHLGKVDRAALKRTAN